MKGILRSDEAVKGKASKQVRTFVSCFEEFKNIDDFLDSAKVWRCFASCPNVHVDVCHVSHVSLEQCQGNQRASDTYFRLDLRMGCITNLLHSSAERFVTTQSVVTTIYKCQCSGLFGGAYAGRCPTWKAGREGTFNQVGRFWGACPK